MSKLVNESTLYKKLSEQYDNKHGEITTLDFYKECVNFAITTSDIIEINFILYKLKYLSVDNDSGIDKVNIITKLLRILTSNNNKITFMISVLETALEEIKR